MGKGGPKEQVVTNKLDPVMEHYRNEVFDKARQVSGQGYRGYDGQTVAGADPMSGAAAGAMGGMPGAFRGIANQFNGGGPNIGPYANAGSAAARALGGDQGAIQSMMDPYQHNVVDALGTEYDRARSKAALESNTAATAGGAFGGDRHALMTGERLGALDRGQMSDTANILSGGFNSMMDRAGQTANLGLGAQGLSANYRLGAGGLQLDAQRGAADAIGQQFGMGDYFRNINQQGLDDKQRQFMEQRDWGNRQLGILQSGMTGTPYGNTESQPLYKNGLNTVAGGAATGFAIGGPVGAGIGAGASLLFG